MKGQALFCSALAILLLSSSTDGIPMSGHESDSLVKRWAPQAASLLGNTEAVPMPVPAEKKVVTSALIVDRTDQSKKMEEQKSEAKEQQKEANQNKEPEAGANLPEVYIPNQSIPENGKKAEVGNQAAEGAVKTDAAQDSKKDGTQDAAKDGTQDANKDGTQDAKKDAAQDAKKDAAQDAKKDAAQDAKKDAAQDSKKDATLDPKKDAAQDAKKGAAETIFETFCDSAKLAQAIGDGTQKKTATCSKTIQGAIPSFDSMTSTIILTPADGAKIPLNGPVQVEVRTNNLDLGFFEDPNARYYQTPQTLNAQGIIEGHQHVTVQRLAAIGAAVNTPPDARTETLAFFKGLDDDTQNGILRTEIPAGSLNQPGIYRICTITGTRGHQPVLMPVARRGSQDDCIRVTVQ